jgi:hypothetical protein
MIEFGFLDCPFKNVPRDGGDIKRGCESGRFAYFVAISRKKRACRKKD